jgi:outer membrane protein OmpA-like peptidoglycan-associated protein
VIKVCPIKDFTPKEKMKMNQLVKKVIVLIAALAVPFVTVSAQTATDPNAILIEGVIVTRDGDNVLMRTAAGNSTVTLTDATKVDALKGLVGIRSDRMSVTSLIPGLKIKVEAEPKGSQVIAKGIKFHVDDLQRAIEIQAALAVPQQQVKDLQAKVKEQEQENVALNKRFSDLADYDLKGEATVLFDVNSANLSEKAKADLKALADTAKTIKGYMIQVAGHADSTGSAANNQQLSDRRAESVVTYLRQSCDVGMSRVLSPVAMGESKAVAPNETAQGKADNRRVTVKVIVNRGIAAQ